VVDQSLILKINGGELGASVKCEGESPRQGTLLNVIWGLWLNAASNNGYKQFTIGKDPRRRDFVSRLTEKGS